MLLVGLVGYGVVVDVIMVAILIVDVVMMHSFVVNVSVGPGVTVRKLGKMRGVLRLVPVDLGGSVPMHGRVGMLGVVRMFGRVCMFRRVVDGWRSRRNVGNFDGRTRLCHGSRRCGYCRRPEAVGSRSR
jgi:hypothetical protein